MARYIERYEFWTLSSSSKVVFEIYDGQESKILAVCQEEEAARRIVEALNNGSLFHYDTELKEWVAKI